ncbi:MAG: IS21 family transposase [Zetaproteobacteria bacterium]|nr:MAG: IS21 family transposase [Zetaproteobacteria bacterium]
MRQDYKAGETVFVDYCGPTVNITNPKTGEIKTAQIFVGVLGASNYIYADATWSQKVGHWVMSHAKMFEFFGGVPEVIVCDNLKSAVDKVSLTDPVINSTYQAMADHFGTSIFAARPYKPQDKAKAENSVLIIERWILFRLRKVTFTSLHQLNAEILKLLEDVNNRPFQKIKGCRSSLFKSIDQPALKQLPLTRFTTVEHRKIRADFGYHISLYNHDYSVPEALSGVELDVHVSADVIEVFHRGERACSHARSYETGKTTKPEHMPKQHRHLAEFTEDEALQWGLEMGQATHDFMQTAMKEARRRDDSYRLLTGMKKLEEEYGQERIEKASIKCLGIGGTKLRNIRSILKTNLDRTVTEKIKINEADFEHENIRGSKYYH